MLFQLLLLLVKSHLRQLWAQVEALVDDLADPKVDFRESWGVFKAKVHAWLK